MKTSYIKPIILGGLLSIGAALLNATYYYAGDTKVVLHEVAETDIPTPGNIATHNAVGNKINKVYTDGAIDRLEATNGLVVKLRHPEDTTALFRLGRELGAAGFRQDSHMPLWYEVWSEDESGFNAIEVAARMYESGLFRYAEPLFNFNPFCIAYDDSIMVQWGLYNKEFENQDISVSEAWNYATGKGITIAIIDQLVDRNHEDLAANMHPFSYYGNTMESPTPLPHPEADHGTHCAGIAAAVRNNGKGIAGVAPDARIMSCAFTTLAVPGYEHAIGGVENAIVRSIHEAWKHGADILSCSWTASPKQYLGEAIDSALIRGRNGKGCILVAGAGNRDSVSSGFIRPTTDYSLEPGIVSPVRYSYQIGYPATHEGVLAIGAIDSIGRRAVYSCYGEDLFITAPGSHIVSCVPGNEYKIHSGTSMATPVVAGVVALILERNPDLTREEVAEILATTTKKLGISSYNKSKEYGTWNQTMGYGVVNAAEAVKAVRQSY